MAYADPALIRDVVIQVRLNDNEADLLDAVVKYTGQQKSTLMRELFLRQAQRVLMGDGDIDLSQRQSEPAQQLLEYAR
jgi:uncharacterized protein (DUF1778 family)